MRRSVAILVLLVSYWMLLLPAFGFSAEPNLPACCRKDGKHHCMMEQEGRSENGASFSVIAKKCPQFPRTSVAVHADTFAPPCPQAIFAGLICHPAGSPQTEARYRTSDLRSRQKRGPPSPLFS